MQYIHYRFGDQEKWGRVEGDSVVELSAPPWTDNLQEGRRFTPDPDLPHLPPCEPTKIVCVGKNYSAHIQELHPGEDIPKEPLLFLKPPSALLPPGGTILIPPQSERVDYEGEVAVVIGRELSWGSVEEVRRAIFGYTLANDVTARDLQRKDVQFTRGKGFDTFCPVGPLLCKNLPEGAGLVTEVNGEVRQKAPLTQMIFSPEEIVGYVSRIMTLLPGDIILTGTPEGVGPLKPGDVVEVELQGLGILHNAVKTREAS
jgi:2-keto-4-pentenoate hydratase/2-oxohepta-3-ene-1,7-dioic acid hydratase in catechol pathway